MSYIKTVWATGDVVTATRLNNMEEGIEDNDYAITNLPEATTTTAGLMSASDKVIVDSVETAAEDIAELQSDVSENESTIKQGFYVVENLLYSGDWNPDYAEITFSGNNVTVAVTSTTNKYANCYIDIDVADYDSVTLSYESLTRGSDSNGRVRYGSLINGSPSWIGFLTDTGESLATIDTTSIDTLRVQIYAIFNRTPAIGTYVTISKLQLVYGSISYEFMTSPTVQALDVGETGETVYYGERIRINTLEQLYRCQVDIWQDFTNDTYGLYANQSLAIYNNYMFLLQNEGGIVVLDKTTKEVVGTMTLSVSSNHQNSAQFTNIFADESDTFPLLLISRCGNASTTSASPLPGTDAVIFARITLEDSTFSIETYGLIKLNITTFGSSWGIDNATNRLVNLSYLNATYTTTTDNDPHIYVFDMPELTAIYGHTVELDVADAISSFDIPYYIVQGIYVNGDNIFQTAKLNDKMYIYVTSISKQQRINIIPLDISYEAEGIAIDDGIIYASFREGTDTSGTNPLKIYTITT